LAASLAPEPAILTELENQGYVRFDDHPGSTGILALENMARRL
jgi:hypothetical protein